MHHSRLTTIVIDCDDIEVGTTFWKRALGVEVKGQDETYVELEQPIPGLYFVLQRVPERKTAKSRVHLDIGTDDVETEVARLETLGAKRIERIEDWWIMHDPCGNEFCVIPVSDSALETAKGWP
jgi:predicted enzyme related to lactoylglutathione lyase